MKNKFFNVMSITAAVLLFAGCPTVQLSSDAQISSFTFTAASNTNLPYTVTAAISGTSITAAVPADTSITSLVASFTVTGTSVSVESTVQTSGTTANDFSSPVLYTVTAEDGSTQDYTVTVTELEISGILPEDNSATADTSALLSWDTISEATSYEVQIAAAADGVESASSATTTDGSLNPSAPPAGFSWYWRVRAMHDSVPITRWSSIRSLRIGWTNFPITLTAPDNGASTDDTTPELSWASFGGAESYEIQFAAGSEINMQAAEPIVSSETSYVFTEALDNNTTYYWRVRGVSTDVVSGETIYSAYSVVRSFTVSWGTSGPADGIRFSKELALLASDTSLLSGSYELTADIDLTEFGEWTPIGYITTKGSQIRFSGSFNGNNHTISGLTINNNTVYGGGVGLFGIMSDTAEIKNINLTNVNILSNESIGGVVGLSYGGTISGCSVNGNFGLNSDQTGKIGGIAGTCYGGNISDCSTSGSIKLGSVSGGIIGNYVYSESETSITHCTSSCTIEGKSYSAGIIAQIFGLEQQLTVTDCSSSGSVSGCSYVGGLIGKGSTMVLVSNCFSTADVTGTENYCGGLIGEAEGENFLIQNCYATGNVSGSQYIGGLTGATGHYSTSSGMWTDAATITGCYASGSVSATDYAGGLVGQHSTTGIISNSFSLGDVQGTNNIGGFIGLTMSNIINCYSIGSVTGVNYSSGFCGKSSTSNLISTCYYNRDISGVSPQGYATPLYTTEMRTRETYIDARWDFVNEEENGTNDIWSMDPNYIINNGYPYLTAFPLD